MLLLLWLACTGKTPADTGEGDTGGADTGRDSADTGADSGGDSGTDADGDGYTTRTDNGDDCDDTNPEVHPGAREVCDPDNTDEDCNGFADNDDDGADPSTRHDVYTDADGDTYGAEPPSARCDTSTGESDRGLDCNDADPTVHPTATEMCDEAHADEDCDGLVDDADPSVDPTSTLSVYDDDDGDGYGAGATRQVCAPGAHEVETGGDCDDTDASLNPSDSDTDGYSSCAGDCDDNSALISPADLDSDGLSGCAGDCDDADPSRTSGCSYTSMIGELSVSDFGCDYGLVGTADDGSACPDCEFSFDTIATLLSPAECSTTFGATFGFDADTSRLEFLFESKVHLGSLDAWITPGGYYDTLYFSDYGYYGYLYEGSLRLY